MSLSRLLTLALLMVSLVGLAGCSSKGDIDETADGGAAAGMGGQGGASSYGAGAGGGIGAHGGSGGIPSSPAELVKVIYFDFDQDAIRDEYREQVVAHALYLKNNPQASLTIEGHCDERGTREYNLALGERRAKAVRNFLLLEGVASNQIEVVSYGEERAENPEHSEEAWSQNRRAQFRY